MGYIGLQRDITEHKQAEKELRESEEWFRSVYNNATDGIIISKASLEREPVIIDVNTAACEMNGYAREELIGKTLKLLDKDPNFFPEKGKRLATGEALIFETTHTRKDDSTFPVEVSLKNIQIGGKTYVVAIERDITERKQAEEALRTNEAQLSNAMQIARLGYWEYDVAEDLFTFNDHFYSIFRTTAERVGGYKMSSARYAQLFLHPDDRALVAVETKKALETTDPHFSRQLEHRIIYADGEPGYISVRFFVVKDNQGRTVKTYGANQDITEQKKQKRKRKKKKKKKKKKR